MTDNNGYCIDMERLKVLHHNIKLVESPIKDPRTMENPYAPDVPEEFLETWFTFLDAKDKLNEQLKINGMEVLS